MRVDEHDNIGVFQTLSKTAKQLHLSRSHLYRLEAEGALLRPAVFIAPDAYGWTPERVQEYGLDVKRLDADGEEQKRATEGALPEMQELVFRKYGAEPKLYLGQSYCSFVYGLQKHAVYFLRLRGQKNPHTGGFIHADVRIDKRYGWDEMRVIEFGLQTGRLNDEKINTWAWRRTAEFGLPDADWVAKRAAEIDVEESARRGEEVLKYPLLGEQVRLARDLSAANQAAADLRERADDKAKTAANAQETAAMTEADAESGAGEPEQAEQAERSRTRADELFVRAREADEAARQAESLAERVAEDALRLGVRVIGGTEGDDGDDEG